MTWRDTTFKAMCAIADRLSSPHPQPVTDYEHALFQDLTPRTAACFVLQQRATDAYAALERQRIQNAVG